MEDLNKHQLVLLTLLVSFVTSIATGIIVFTLLQEVPVAVTQTINRVVERTIETVVPEGGGKEVVREIQIVNEEDLVLESIDKNTKSIVRVKTLGFDGTEVVVGLGIVLQDGVVVIDMRSFTAGSNYSVLFDDSKVYGVAKTYTEGGFVFLKVGKPANEKYTFYPAILGNADILKLGQTIVAVGGKSNNTVSVGRISELKLSQSKSVEKISTNILLSNDQPGSPLLNLSGEIVGFEALSNDGSINGSYTPINSLKNLIKNAVTELSK